MGTYRNNLSPLPLYDSLDEQLHRRPYSHGYIYPLLVSQDYLIPFFASFPSEQALSVESIEVYKLCTCGDVKTPITYPQRGGDFNRDFNFDFFVSPSVSQIGIHTAVMEVEGREWSSIFYDGNPDSKWDLPRGIYYLVLRLDAGITLYSEVFMTVPDSELEKKVRILWSDTEDLKYDSGFIPYSLDYKNLIYLSTEIGKPEYPFEEEGKDRDGYFFPEKQISKKTFRFTVLGTESLYDSMRLIGMSDYITIEDEYGRTYYPKSFSSEIEWLEDGYLAEIQCEFNTDTVVKTVGKPIY